MNFFTHHYMLDMRIVLFAATAAAVLAHLRPVHGLARRSGACRCCSASLLVALFIWFAENIGTFAAAWVYPNQRDGWTLVSLAKLGSWYLLMMLSFVLVALVNRPQAMMHAKSEHGREHEAAAVRLGFQPASAR